MKILVTGATGRLGSKVVKALMERVPVNELAVSVRNPEKAAALQAEGVEVRHGNFDQPESLDIAFAGIDRLLIISTDSENELKARQHINAVDAAKRAGVPYIAYTSMANAAESRNRLAPPHHKTEQAVLAAGIPYTLLRNNCYLENELSSIQGAVAGAPWITSAGEGKAGWAPQEDFAEAAANVLTGEGHENKTYELSGPLLTMQGLVQELEEVLEKEIPLKKVDDETFEHILKEYGLPDPVISLVTGIQHDIRQGTMEVENSDFEKVLGRSVTPMRDALNNLVKVQA
ncbi:SDR family oxidoreductase [Alkalicoccus halolimnae]|uniref:SDR family oxidoreductase n=1 Tax=Alkalicoccus halolimnae TaxID=1667239 RepID=A0A5C7F360_9BACI|nr:SDR family oxidoreductase [Alkalicoccus halolimnae]TXF81823.1 SDR family oxidoreductase [Alkalicoccus halolimnae]